MPQSEPVFYLIPGLGADGRIFERLRLRGRAKILEWLPLCEDFLDELVRHFGGEDPVDTEDVVCPECCERKATIRCMECDTRQLVCSECIVVEGRRRNKRTSGCEDLFVQLWRHVKRQDPCSRLRGRSTYAPVLPRARKITRIAFHWFAAKLKYKASQSIAFLATQKYSANQLVNA